MRYVNFNKTDLQVSALCLGTSGFGTNVPESVSFEQMDLFRELGGTFMDTARVYGDWDPSNPGASEKTIGKWMAARGCREKTVISTKGGHPILGVWHISRCTPDQLEQDLSESLDHLQTE